MIDIDYYRLIAIIVLLIKYFWSFIAFYAKKRIVHSCACRIDYDHCEMRRILYHVSHLFVRRRV